MIFFLQECMTFASSRQKGFADVSSLQHIHFVDGNVICAAIVHH